MSYFPYNINPFMAANSVFTGDVKEHFKYSPFFHTKLSWHLNPPKLPNQYDQYNTPSVAFEAWIQLSGEASTDYAAANTFITTSNQEACTDVGMKKGKEVRWFDHSHYPIKRESKENDPAYTWHHVFMGYQKCGYFLDDGTPNLANVMDYIACNGESIFDASNWKEVIASGDGFPKLWEYPEEYQQEFTFMAFQILKTYIHFYIHGILRWCPCKPHDNGWKSGYAGEKDTGNFALMQLVPSFLHESTLKHKGSNAQWKDACGLKKKNEKVKESDKPKLKASSRLSTTPKYSSSEVSSFERKMDIKLPKLAKELYRGAADLRELTFKCALRSLGSRSTYELSDATVQTLFPLEIEGDKKHELQSLEYFGRGDYNPSIERSYTMHANEQSCAFLEPPVPNAVPFGWDEFGELLYISDDMVFRYDHDFDNFTPFVLT